MKISTKFNAEKPTKKVVDLGAGDCFIKTTTKAFTDKLHYVYMFTGGTFS